MRFPSDPELDAAAETAEPRDWSDAWEREADQAHDL